jgi:riboflavin kinase / FMN adenylyltransferase
MPRPWSGIVVVVTFDRHPNSVVAPDRTPAPIYSLEQKLRVLENLAVDATWLIPFDEEFSRIEADEFVRQLARDFAPLHSLSVGSGFTFGYRRRGTWSCWTGWGANLVFRCTVGRGRASRGSGEQHADSGGDSDRGPGGGDGHAGPALFRGRPVVRGDGLGRRMGIPTANLAVTELVLPPDGVYAAEVILDGRRNRRC